MMSAVPRRGSLPYPVGMLAALALVAGMELFAIGPKNDLDTFIPASWSEASRAAQCEAITADVLFLGDSQVKGGLIPAAFDQSVHLHTYNLAVIGGQPASALALLRQAIDAGARPRALVIGFYPGLLGADSRINLRQWPDLLGTSGCMRMLWSNRDFAFVAPLLMHSLLPSLRRREEIRAALVSLATGQPDVASIKAQGYRRNWRLNAGAQALPINHAFLDESLPPPGEPGAALNKTGKLWRAKAEHLDSLRKLLAQADARGIAVFWLLPTNAPGLRAFRQSSGLEAAYLRTIQGLQSEFPGLIVLDPNHVLNGPTGFSDPCHLDHLGAWSLSMATAEAIRSRLSLGDVADMRLSQWITLAGPADGAPFAIKTLEDVDQSTRVVQIGIRDGKTWR